MNYMDEIFWRADIQQIREFLLHGGECSAPDRRSYRERVESAWRTLAAGLRAEYPDDADYERITRLVDAYGWVLEDVYMEIGLQTGAILAVQIYQNRNWALERG